MGKKSFYWTSATVVLMTLVVAVALLFVFQKQKSAVQTPITDQMISKLSSEFQNQNEPLQRFFFPINWNETYTDDLFRPEAIVPSLSYTDAELKKITSVLDRCEPWPFKGTDKTPNSATVKKYHLYFKHKCKSEPLQKSLWSEPPFKHPLGGSWAAWIANEEDKDVKWLRKQKPFLHILEYSLLKEKKPDQWTEVASGLTPDSLKRLMEGRTIVESQKYLLLLTHYEPTKKAYHLYPIKSWQVFLKNHNLALNQQASPGCVVINDNYCWSYLTKNKVLLTERSLRNILIFLILFLVVFILYGLWRRYQEDAQFRDQQQLVMQTLAHELRHPVTGFRLSVEAIRPFYDQLPEEVNLEFLRLASTSQRMTRIVNFSQSYLQLLMKDGQFLFQKNDIASFGDFLESCLDSYAEKIEIQHPSTDLQCCLDSYWVSTCIKNLVINALTYGSTPIVVSWHHHDNEIDVEVKDNGRDLSKDLKDLVNPQIKKSDSSGLGLGLSLVYRVIQLMGGDLGLKKNPTRFTITLRGAINEKNPDC